MEERKNQQTIKSRNECFKPDVSKRQHLISETAEDALSCLQCGACSASCPVWRFSSLSPRQIMRFISLGNEDEIMRQEALYYCSACYSCAMRCPAGIKVTNVIRDLRNVMVDRQIGPLPPHLELVGSVRNYDNPWQKPRAQRDRWVKKARVRMKVVPGEEAEFLYYPGCTAAYIPAIQNVAVSAAKLLDALGVDFGILGKDEICCGSTSMRVGMRDFFIRQAERNIERLNASKARVMVTACAGCYGIMKLEYPKFGELNMEVLHIVEFLSRLLMERRDRLHPLDLAVTYHDPCHLARHAGVTKEPREVLSLIPGLRFIEMPRSGVDGRCCGGGGGLRTGYPHIAHMIASERIEEAVEAGAEAVITCCPFCELNLGEASAASYGIEVFDIVEILWRSVGGDLSSV